jgi:hypothetical protein
MFLDRDRVAYLPTADNALGVVAMGVVHPELRCEG